MSGKQQAIVLIVHGILAGLVLCAASILLALHDMDAQAYTALIGAALGLLGGSAGSLAVVGFTGNGKPPGTTTVTTTPSATETSIEP